jgi:PAS domain S-box-containing protein
MVSESRFSEDVYRLAVDAADVGTWDFDPVLDVLIWCYRTKAMFGISADVPCSMADFYAGLHPEDLDATSKAFDAAVDPACRITYDVEYRTIGKEDGIIRWISAKGRGLFDDVGTCIRVIGTTMDITARKATEEKLHRREAELQELTATLEQRVAERTAERDRAWNNAQNINVIVGQDGLLRAVNPAWTRILGWEYAELVGRHYLDFIYPDDRPLGEEAFIKASSEPTTKFENRQLHKDGSFRWISWVATPDAGLIYANGRDITETKQNQIELDIAQEHLRQAQKIEAIGQLTAGVAHDFNNLLMVMSGGLDMLERQPKPERRARLLDGMRQAVKRGATLTRQLLAFSRRQPLRPESVDLKRQIGGMHELLDRSLRGDVNVATRFAPDLWPVEIDPGELELVLLNLCVNARDAMPQGGTITLEAENIPDGRTEGCQGDYVRLSVIDDGTGMSPEVLARVYEPFFTTKDIGKGSGLGLAQVHGFAQQSGGRVTIESEVGRGTKVNLLLPKSDKRPIPREHHLIDLPATETTEHPQALVLLVEDDHEVAMLVTEMLSDLGYNVIRTGSAEGALGALANEREVDLVFADVMMPGGMSGVDLARAIKERRPELPVVLTSGYMFEDKSRARVQDFTIVAKPYQIDTLAMVLRKALAQEAD